jgi:hypothetical protein
MTKNKLREVLRKCHAVYWLPLLTLIFLCLAIYKQIEAKNSRETFPYSQACRGDFLSEVQYDDRRFKMNATLSFSFLNKNKILVSMSGNVYAYDKKGKLVDKRIVLRNIYYSYVLENKILQTYTLKSDRVNIDSVDTMNEELSRLVLMNSSYIVGDFDTLVLKKYDANSMLIETTQSPLIMCVFVK